MNATVLVLRRLHSYLLFRLRVERRGPVSFKYLSSRWGDLEGLIPCVSYRETLPL